MAAIDAKKNKYQSLFMKLSEHVSGARCSWTQCVYANHCFYV